MTVARRILLIAAGLCGAVLIGSYTATYLGYTGTLIGAQHPDVCPFLQVPIEHLIFMVNFFLFSSFVLDIYDRRILRAVLPYAAIHIGAWIVTPVGGYMYLTAAIPVLYLVCWLLYLQDLRRGMLRLLSLGCFLVSYQYISLIVKTGCFAWTYNHVGFYAELIIAIDLLIFTAIFYCLGGERKHEKICADQLVLFPGKIGSAKESAEDTRLVESFRAIAGYKKALAVLLLFGFQIMQWLFILMVCYIGSVFIEGVLITLSYVAFGIVIKRRVHTSVILCTVISSIMFYAAARAIPPFGHSQFLPVLVGLLLIYAMYRAAIHGDHDFVLERFCDRARMVEIATARGLTPFEIDLLDYKFCKGYTQAQLEARFAGWSLSSIKRMIKAAKNKFEN